MRLPFQGEVGDYNIYDVPCELAQDVDVSEGVLQGRWADVQLVSGLRRRVFVKGDGTVLSSADVGWGFVWGNDVYLINSSEEWYKNGDPGTGTKLEKPSAPPTINAHSAVVPYYAPSSSNQYSPQPVSFAQNGWNSWNVSVSGWQVVEIVLSTGTQDWSEYSGINVAVKMPAEPLSNFRVLIQDIPLPETKRVRLAGNYHYISFDLSMVPNKSSISSITFQYETDENHIALIHNWIHLLYGVSGKVVYLATVTTSNVESVASKPYEVPVLHDRYYSYGVSLYIGNVSSGNVVRLYRAQGSSYYLVAEGTATSSQITLTDKGTLGERYVPGGLLPYGPAVVWGNRVAIAQGNELYFSAAGDPEKYSQSVLSSTTDPYRVILPENVVAVTTIEGALAAYGRQHLWLWQPSRAMYENDDLSSVIPQKVESVIPLGARSVDGEAVAARDGLYIGGRLVFRKRWQSVHPIVLSRGSFVCVIDGTTMYVYKEGQPGWVRYTMPTSSPFWIAWDGSYPLVAGWDGVYRIGAGNNRFSSTWRSGRITVGNKFLIDWMHVYTSQTCAVKVITDLGSYATKSFLYPDRWKPTDTTYGGRALRWVQIEVIMSPLQKCEAIELDLKPVPLK